MDVSPGSTAEPLDGGGLYAAAFAELEVQFSAVPFQFCIFLQAVLGALSGEESSARQAAGYLADLHAAGREELVPWYLADYELLTWRRAAVAWGPGRGLNLDERARGLAGAVYVARIMRQTGLSRWKAAQFYSDQFFESENRASETAIYRYLSKEGELNAAR